MIRWGMPIFLWVCVVSHGQTLRGIVANRIEQPLQGAKVCLLGFADRCAFSDDSGHWSLTVPAGIRPGSGSGGDKGFFSIGKGRRTLLLQSSASGPLRLHWMDAMGRPLVSSGLPLPDRLSGSWQLSREILATLPAGMILLRARQGPIQRTFGLLNLPGEAVEIRTIAAGPLAKAASHPRYYLEISLAGYETLFETADEPPEIDWISLTPLGETRDHRSYGIIAPILAINREEAHIETQNRYSTCDSGKLVERISDVKMPFHLHGGKLYIPRSGDSCRAHRFTGGGADLLGAWLADDLHAEMPAPARPAGCPSVLPFSNPPAAGATLSYRFTATEMSLGFSGPSCLSDERWYPARNLIMFNDRTVRWVENSCRRTAWVNTAGDSAFQSFQIHGGLDSARVTFTYKDKTCAYLDDGQFSDPPPTCPDPVVKAQADYLDCIAASGFANIPRTPRQAGPLAKRRVSERGRTVSARNAHGAREAFHGWYGRASAP